MCRNVGDGGRRADGQAVVGLGDCGHTGDSGEADQLASSNDAVLDLGQQVGAAAHGHRAGPGEEGDGFVHGLGFGVLEGGHQLFVPF